MGEPLWEDKGGRRRSRRGEGGGKEKIEEEYTKEARLAWRPRVPTDSHRLPAPSPSSPPPSLPTSCLPIHAAYPAPSGWRHAQDASGVKLPPSLRPFLSSSRSLFLPPPSLPPSPRRHVPPTLLHNPVGSSLPFGGITIPCDS